MARQMDPERILQEAALLVDRSDIQEELVRLNTHVKHFLGLLDEGGEVGKKLDFLLQEMNREANTLLSKTSGLAGEALENHRDWAGDQDRNRKGPRTGAEPRMSASTSFRRLRDRANPRWWTRCARLFPAWIFPFPTPPGRRAATSRTAANISSSRAQNSRR